VSYENFTLLKEPMQNVTEMFDLQRGHAKKNIKTYQIYKQLIDNEYEIDTDRFTLIEMATGDAILSDYFEMQENVLFSHAGLERFYKLCVEKECPVSNPQSFRKLAYIIKNGEKTHLNLVLSRDTPIAIVHEQVVALKERGKVQSDLEEIKRSIMNLPLLGFTDNEAEWNLIQDISNLVETKLVPLISGEATTSNDESMPTTALEASDCTDEEFQGFILKTLERRPNQSCQAKSLSTFVIQYLGIYTSGNPRKRLLQLIETQISYLENYGLIQRYSNRNRLKLLSIALPTTRENDPADLEN
jgi:hypothetical protein